VDAVSLASHIPLNHAFDHLRQHAIRWDDYEQSDRIELGRLSEQAAKDQWWTWPEAIAWLGERDSKNIATLRFWASRWRGDGDPAIAIAAQDYIARQYCVSPREAEAALIRSIESGIVKTYGRSSRNGISVPLDKGHWRGGTVVYSEGTAQLASATNMLIAWAFDIAVDRADLMRGFPGEEISEGSGIGIQDGQAVVSSESGSSAARQRGRRLGSGTYAIADAPLLAEMKDLIEAGKANSPDGAAKMVAAKAAGAATIESKASRLARAYRGQPLGE
jgi:hypothetical protein